MKERKQIKLKFYKMSRNETSEVLWDVPS